MIEIPIGSGGWAYISTGEKDNLRAYSQIFDFVEVNYTFYNLPKLSTVRSWRSRVPRDFVFSVKCNKTVTHKTGLQSIEETYKVLRYMREICRLLRTDLFVVQTPPSLIVDVDMVEEAVQIFNSTGLGEYKILWEARASKNRANVEKKMIENEISPVVDITRVNPNPDSFTQKS